jgi:type III pantothenate kinase
VRIESHPHPTKAQVATGIRELCLQASMTPADITRAGIASVVPAVTIVVERVVKDFLSIEPVTVSSALDLGIRVHYRNPTQVGADRLCNAIAGFKKYGGPLIIIDFGTATTFDVVSKEGDYLGGVIALGLESSAEELHRLTALLPKIKLQFPESVIGQDTASSMQAGVMVGTVEAVEGLVRRIRAEISQHAKVVATGGLSSVIAKHTKIIEAVEPSLVLEGVRLICERVTGNRS